MGKSLITEPRGTFAGLIHINHTGALGATPKTLDLGDGRNTPISVDADKIYQKGVAVGLAPLVMATPPVNPAVDGVTLGGNLADATGLLAGFLPEDGVSQSKPLYVVTGELRIGAFIDDAAAPPKPVYWYIQRWGGSGWANVARSTGVAGIFATPDLVTAWTNLNGSTGTADIDLVVETAGTQGVVFGRTVWDGDDFWIQRGSETVPDFRLAPRVDADGNIVITGHIPRPVTNLSEIPAVGEIVRLPNHGNCTCMGRDGKAVSALPWQGTHEVRTGLLPVSGTYNIFSNAENISIISDVAVATGITLTIGNAGSLANSTGEILGGPWIAFTCTVSPGGSDRTFLVQINTDTSDLWGMDGFSTDHWMLFSDTNARALLKGRLVIYKRAMTFSGP